MKGGGRTVLWSRYFHQILALVTSTNKHVTYINNGFEPEEFPLDVRLSEDPVVGVDHPGPEDTEEDDEGDELVEGPEDVARDVGDALLNVVIKLSHHAVPSHGAGTDQFGLHHFLSDILNSLEVIDVY